MHRSRFSRQRAGRSELRYLKAIITSSLELSSNNSSSPSLRSIRRRSCSNYSLLSPSTWGEQIDVENRCPTICSMVQVLATWNRTRSCRLNADWATIVPLRARGSLKWPLPARLSVPKCRYMTDLTATLPVTLRVPKTRIFGDGNASATIKQGVQMLEDYAAVHPVKGARHNYELNIGEVGPDALQDHWIQPVSTECFRSLCRWLSVDPPLTCQGRGPLRRPV